MPIQRTFAAVAGFAALVSAAAHAAPASNPTSDVVTVSKTVSVADLDIGSPAGANAALARLRYAAKAACDPGGTPLDGGTQYRACVSDAVDRAVASLGSPVLTAINSGHDQTAAVLAARDR